MATFMLRQYSLSDYPKQKSSPTENVRGAFYTMGNLQLVIGNWLSSFCPIPAV
jgi:hypothetical protein